MKKCICIALSLGLLLTGCHTDAPETDSSTPPVPEVSTTITTESASQTTITTTSAADTTATTSGTVTAANKKTTTTSKKTTTAGKKTTTTTSSPPVDMEVSLAADPSRAPSNDVVPLSFACTIHDGYVYYYGGPNTQFPDWSTLFRKPLTGDGEAEKVPQLPDVHSFRYAVCGNKLYYLSIDAPAEAHRLYVCNLDGSNAKLLVDTGQNYIDVDLCYATENWLIYTCALPNGGTQLYLLSTDGKTKKVGTDLKANEIPWGYRIIGFNRGYLYYDVAYKLKEDLSTVGPATCRIDYRSQNPVPERLTYSYNGIPISQYGQVHNDYIYYFKDNDLMFASLLDENDAIQSLKIESSSRMRLWDYFVNYVERESKYEYTGWQGERKTVHVPRPESCSWPDSRPSVIPNTNYLYCWMTTEHNQMPNTYSATATLVLFDPDGNIHEICEITA